MPASRTKRERNRGDANKNQVFVAEQLKQQIFGKDAAGDSGSDGSADGDEDVNALIQQRQQQQSKQQAQKNKKQNRQQVTAASNNNNAAAAQPTQHEEEEDEVSDNDDEDDDYHEDEYDPDLVMDAELRRNGLGLGQNRAFGDDVASFKSAGSKTVGVSASGASASLDTGGTVAGNASREKDRSERATNETVMDPRTRLILHKMVNSQILERVHGCVSTGKEANVYLGVLGSAAQGIWEASNNITTGTSTTAQSDNTAHGNSNNYHPQDYVRNSNNNSSSSKKSSSLELAKKAGAVPIPLVELQQQEAEQQQQAAKNNNNDDDDAMQQDQPKQQQQQQDATKTKEDLAAASEARQLKIQEQQAAAEHPFVDGAPVAIKIYKTSILVFKDREKYVSGEYRFQRYCKSNPRKMVRTWAEKESRNLNRLHSGGVPCPRVFLLRQHLLALEFIGTDGWPAPKLKDVRLSQSAFEKCYLQVVLGMRKMFQNCRLVHGDLSEFNLLVFNGKVIFIDVSQSVEHDHPHSMDFLRRDIVNVHTFFRQRGVAICMTHRECFDYITSNDPNAPWVKAAAAAGGDCGEQWLQEMKETWRSREVASGEGDKFGNEQQQQSSAANGGKTSTSAAKHTKQQKEDDNVFLQVPVPRDLKGDGVLKSLANPDVAHFVKAMLPSKNNGNDDDASFSSSDDDDDEEGSSSSGEDDDNVNAAGGKTTAAAANADDTAQLLARFDAAVSTDATLKEQTAEMIARIRQLLIEHSRGTVRLANMNKEEKKLFQHVVKMEKRRGRTEKVPKHIKKRATKKHMKK